MKTKTIALYSFNELNDEQKNVVIEKNRDINVDFEWYDSSIADFKAALKLIGFYDVKVRFSGFSSQGNGAQFTGNYDYSKGALKKVKAEYPNWVALHNLASELQEIQSKYFYKIGAKITSTGHYLHEYCTSFELFLDGDYFNSDNIESEFIESCRDFMREIYGMLNNEYDHLTSDKAVIETIESNEYFFNSETLEIDS